MKALPDWPLMAVLVEHMEGQRDLITHKSVWHLSDEAMKNVCEYYIIIHIYSHPKIDCFVNLWLLLTYLILFSHFRHILHHVHCLGMLFLRFYQSKLFQIVMSLEIKLRKIELYFWSHYVSLLGSLLWFRTIQRRWRWWYWTLGLWEGTIFLR